jgi:diguanylate cyclase (GGDEF)-like protein
MENQQSLKPDLVEPWLSTVFQDSPDIIFVANAHLDIVAANKAARHILHRHPGLFICKSNGSLHTLYHADRKTVVQQSELPMRRVVGGDVINDVIYYLHTPEGDLWFSISGAPIPTSLEVEGGGLLVARDISQRKQHESQTAQSYHQDELTRLLTRSVFLKTVNDIFSSRPGAGLSSISLLFIDIDRFKVVNDSFGHSFGDKLLIEISNRICGVLGPNACIARLGSDEFAILLKDVSSKAEVVDIVDSLVTSISDSYILESHEVYIDLSIGIVMGSDQYQTADDLIRHADIAMYQAKSEAGIYYKFYEPKMHLNTDENLKIEIDLRNALARQEFVIHYQPIVAISSKEIIGFEALVRWNHPELGLLSPLKFIPVAETTGLIVPLGWLVLREACRQMRYWNNALPKASSMFVSVNMSSKQFAQKNVVEKIQSILDETRLPAENLKLELTESILIDHSDSIIAQLEAIRDMGIKLSIDDFGTGYSSLSYLHRFPFDTLKIDRSFIEDADSDFEKLEILQSVIKLAWNLGLEVIAEGIETQKNYFQLKALNCELGQGYLFSRPLDAQTIEALLR